MGFAKFKAGIFKRENTQMAKDKKPIKKKVIEQYEHKDKQRLNNPPVGLVDAETDKEWIIS